MESKNSENRTFLNNHLTLLAIVSLLSGGLYLYFGQPTTLLAAVVGLLLAHLAVATGVLLLARGWLGRAFRKLSETSSRIRRQEDAQKS
jgi:amino acid permease